VSETFRAFSQSQPTILDWHTHWRTKPRSGHRRKQYRRLYGFDWRAVPVRRPRPVRAVPRDYATDRRTAIEGAKPVQFEANRLTVSTPDATAQPRNGRDRSRRDRTAVRRGVSTVYVGDLTDVLETHWSVRTNTVAQLLGVPAVHQATPVAPARSTVSPSRFERKHGPRRRPNCGSTEDTTRHQDTVTCTCGFEGHADLSASETFLRRHETDVARPMARPVLPQVGQSRMAGVTTLSRPNESTRTRKLPPWTRHSRDSQR